MRYLALWFSIVVAGQMVASVFGVDLKKVFWWDHTATIMTIHPFENIVMASIVVLATVVSILIYRLERKNQ